MVTKYETARISGPIIKQLRKEAGMKQKELAEKLNVSRTVVANWETQMRVPTLEQYGYMSELFDVSVDYLTGRTDKKNFSSDNCTNASSDYEYDDIDMSKLNAVGKATLLKLYKALLSDENCTK